MTKFEPEINENSTGDEGLNKQFGIILLPVKVSQKGLKYDNSVILYFINPLKPDFTVVIFIHYKSRLAIAILDL